MSSKIYETGEYYAKHPDWHSKDSPFKALNVFKIIERNNITPKTICEVGCGAGEILVNMYKQLSIETEFFGYEISPQAYRMQKERARKITFLFGGYD
jgi:ubiquinone/menaquinone biosynthesis C-methylase UbiE